MTGPCPAPSARHSRAEGLLAAAVGEELLMMSVAQGAYYNLNSVGSRIWDLLASPITVEELVTVLTGEYEVDAEAARGDVETFLAALRERNLLITSGEAAS